MIDRADNSSASAWHKLRESEAPSVVLLIRIAVAIVFASEGIQKFLYPEALGVGGFAKIGIPAPDVMGPFVGVAEILCGSMLLIGLLTRLAALPLIIDMLVALVSTKVPMLIGRGYWLFVKPSVGKTGFWSALHEARTDLSMLLALVFLFLVGVGSWSLDARTARGSGR